MIELTMVQLLVALFMSLGALCLLLWAILAGMFDDVEGPKYRAYNAELDNDDSENRSGT
ncbi:MAG: cbb3-type cytochrome oxidase assembly protein [Halobacteria archaeon]|nr:cbb3-type cytochrome oxidase assembly protein [Halobacteria archaeon]